MKEATNLGEGFVLAYLVSQYPAVSHTFILREIHQLRQAGIAIRTASIEPSTPGPNGFTEAESREAAATFCVKTRGPLRIALDHATCFARRPRAYLAGLAAAFRLAGLDLKDVLHHLVYFAEAVTVGEWMRRNALPHLHVHFANAAATVALLVKKTHGIPYSITVHGSDEFYGMEFYRLREKVEGASLVRCISRFTRSQLMKASPREHWGKLEICPLGVDPALFKPVGARAGDAFEILCVGRLVAAKGHSVLLAAVARLTGRGRRVKLSLVGDGPDRQALESIAAGFNIRESVHFHGSVNQDRILEFLERADAFVLLSFAEGIPVCLMEAMAMEIPCIATFVGGIPELIQSGEDGILVPASDSDLVADAIAKLIDDSDFRFRLGRGARRKIIEQYNLGANAERLASLFERRLGWKRRAAGGA